MRSELPVASCSLEHLARIARIEPFDFLVAFRRATGATPDQHLVNLRLDRSRDLLSTTDMSVPDIVRRVGFEDDEHYVRLFTTRERCSPQRLRSSSEGRAVTTTTS
jgi:transcriptional regulator GlxA family with amidase domain